MKEKDDYNDFFCKATLSEKFGDREAARIVGITRLLSVKVYKKLIPNDVLKFKAVRYVHKLHYNTNEVIFELEKYIQEKRETNQEVSAGRVEIVKLLKEFDNDKRL